VVKNNTMLLPFAECGAVLCPGRRNAVNAAAKAL
jgi:hypothetical protein